MIIERLLAALIVILPIQFALNVGADVDLVFTRVLTPLIFFLWFLRGLAKRKVWVENGAASWLLLIFLSINAFSLIWARESALGVRKLIYILSLTPLYYVAADIFREKEGKIYVVRSIVISGFLAAVIALAQFGLQFVIGLDKAVSLWGNFAKFFLGSSFSELVLANSSWLVNVSGKTVMRSFGFFPDPHVFSFFVSLCFFVTIGYLLREKNRKWKYAALAGSALMFLAILFSFTRGAYLGLIGTGILFLVIFFRRSGNLPRLLLASAVLAIIVVILSSGSFASRLVSVFNLEEGSNSERLLNWKQAVELIHENPWGGVGLGNYAHAIDPLAQERSSIYAHNIFLDISAETGIINGLIFFMLLAVCFARNLMSKNTLNLGIAAAIFYFSVHGIFDTPIYSPQVFILLMVILAFGPSYEKRYLGK